MKIIGSGEGLENLLKFLSTTKSNNFDITIDENSDNEIVLQLKNIAINGLNTKEFEKTQSITSGYGKNEYIFNCKNTKDLIKLLSSLKKLGDPGHSFSYKINNKELGFDGDGSDYIKQIKENKMKKVINVDSNMLTEMVKSITKKIVESNYPQFEKNNYTHFALFKDNNKIINGWDYSDIDPSELKAFKNDYFLKDINDNGINPKNVKILSRKFLIRNGINPEDMNNWTNDTEPMQQSQQIEDENKCPGGECVHGKTVYSGKTGKPWKAHYDSHADAESGLKGYFANQEGKQSQKVVESIKISKKDVKNIVESILKNYI